MLAKLPCRHALLLQGPNGPFFRRFATELRMSGIEVTKVNFNAGDELFYPGPAVVRFRQRQTAWPAFLERLLETKPIDAIFLFGDGRPLHRTAIETAKARGIAVYVFEEGYLRPNHITLEMGGVNGNSLMPRDPNIYRGATQSSPPPPEQQIGPTFGLGAWYATLYAISCTFFFFLFPHYRHHRFINAWRQAYCWLRGLYRKLYFRRSERHLTRRLASTLSGKFFLFPLQVHCDYQLAHSPFKNIEEAIDYVLCSFAEHAALDHHLVIKHHPMDRAYRDYGEYLSAKARDLGISNRLLYVHDLHLPTLIRHAKGTVTVNSTVGLQSILHGRPVKTLGDAVYDLPGLTHQEALETFWVRQEAIDPELHQDYRSWLCRHNQANGSFTRRLDGVDTPTGIRWFPDLAQLVCARTATSQLPGPGLPAPLNYASRRSPQS